MDLVREAQAVGTGYRLAHRQGDSTMSDLDPEAVERAAIALYEHGRGEQYRNDPEFDWPNIDRAYDWDGDYNEANEPDGWTPEWLRDRIRADARVVLTAALEGLQ